MPIVLRPYVTEHVMTVTNLKWENIFVGEILHLAAYSRSWCHLLIQRRINKSKVSQYAMLVPTEHKDDSSVNYTGKLIESSSSKCIRTSVTMCNLPGDKMLLLLQLKNIENEIVSIILRKGKKDIDICHTFIETDPFSIKEQNYSGPFIKKVLRPTVNKKNKSVIEKLKALD
jgi:hypothetical protein